MKAVGHIYTLLFRCVQRFMGERTDCDRFAAFLSQHLEDPTFEPRFRQGYAFERTRDVDAYRKKRAVVHAIWRVNGRNRQALDDLVSRLDRCANPSAALVLAVRSAALVTISIDGPSGTCSLSNVVVDWPRRVACFDAHGVVSYEALVASEACLWLKCVNVLAHFVEYTSMKLASSGGELSAEWLDNQWGVWQGCLDVVVRWGTTVA